MPAPEVPPALFPPLPAPTPPRWSVPEAALMRGKTRIIANENNQPLKILQPALTTSASHVVRRSYGGPVAGEVIRRRITGGAGARRIRTTQASTRVFRSIERGRG